jgi:hypothetical protein
MHYTFKKYINHSRVCLSLTSKEKAKFGHTLSNAAFIPLQNAMCIFLFVKRRVQPITTMPYVLLCGSF